MAISYIIGKSQEVSRPHVGAQVIKDGRLYGDKKCLICGDWFTWRDIEPEYCFEPSVVRKLRASHRGCCGGTSVCLDYFERMSESEKIKTDERAQRFYLKLRERGVVM